jgi:Histidine kinase-like ATPase domain
MTGQAATHPAAGTTSAPARPAPAHAEVTGGTAHPLAASYQQDFPGRADQLSQVRRDIAGYLGSCPAAADMVLIASELAANAILHSRSRGGTFTIRCQLSARDARIEVEDKGGPWRTRDPGGRPHGLDIIAALTGPGQRGTQITGTGGRIAWARLTW